MGSPIFCFSNHFRDNFDSDGIDPRHEHGLSLHQLPKRCGTKPQFEPPLGLWLNHSPIGSNLKPPRLGELNGHRQILITVFNHHNLALLLTDPHLAEVDLHIRYPHTRQRVDSLDGAVHLCVRGLD
jgi:hypothetical protein